MSKIKKKPVHRPSTTLEDDIIFEKIIQFAGWIFILVLGCVLGIWGILDLLDVLELELDAISFSFVVFFGTSSAFCFALVSKLKKNRAEKKQLFLDFIIGEFLFCLFAIFAIAAFQW